MGLTSDFYLSEESSRREGYEVDSDNESDMDLTMEEPFVPSSLVERLKVSHLSSKINYELKESCGSMNPEIYRAAITGDISGLNNALDDPEFSLLRKLSPQENTLIHIAASIGHQHFVEPILSRCPDQFNSKNSTGDLPLHLAASYGHLSTVRSLISNATGSATSTSGNSEESERKVRDALQEVNNEQNTALHLALENRHKQVAEYLFDLNKEAASCLNRERKSPLYMAVEAGYLDLVVGMIDYIVNSYNPDDKLTGKSVVHAAIRTRNEEMLKKMLSCWSSLMDSCDENGMRPLSYAASIGYIEGVCYILKSKELSECIYKHDRNGFYPIHMASRNGHINVIQKFLELFPDSRELLSQKGQNILHTAADNGKANTVSYMLKVAELDNLINGKDRKGNTPLHLATRKVHPKVVSILTWDKKVNLELVNNKGMTALDIAEDYKGSIPSFQQRLTWQALRYANAPRTVHLKTQSSRTQLKRQSSRTQSKKVSSRTQSKKHRSRTQSNEDHSRIQSSVENYKDRVNTLLLVAILVVTVTFAAGFTLPGGYNSSESDPNKGLATLFRKHTFQVFLISNTIAMYSSMVVAVVLIWAQLGDINLIIASLNLALPLLGIALTMVSSAFMTGAYLVVCKLTWLANFILITGSVFLLTVLVLFVPLFLPSSLNHHVLRYIFYYPFYLLVLVTDRRQG